MGQEDTEIERDTDTTQYYPVSVSSPTGSPATSPSVYPSSPLCMPPGLWRSEGVSSKISVIQSGSSGESGDSNLGLSNERRLKSVEQCGEVLNEDRLTDKCDMSNTQGGDWVNGSYLEDTSLLLLQAQVLMSKNILYQKISFAQQHLNAFPSLIYSALQGIAAMDRGGGYVPAVTSVLRDTTVNSLRFLNMFCNCSSATFFLASSLFDRLISIVPIHPNYISSIGTCCFYMAAKACDCRLPDCAELLKLSRCPGTVQNLYDTERQICAMLHGRATDVTALTFLGYFYEIFRHHFSGVNSGGVAPGRSSSSLIVSEETDDVFGDADVNRLGCGFSDQVYASLVARLEVLVCQFEFTQFKIDILALALLSYDLQHRGLLNSPEQYSMVIELQYFCQMSDVEFRRCRALLIDYLSMYHDQPSRLPRVQLAWSISRKTLHKMRPSTRVSQDLEPILEDELPLCGSTDEETDDYGPLDSESDDTKERCCSDLRSHSLLLPSPHSHLSKP